MAKYSPFFNLLRCHLLVYLREPEAIFWTYGFPLLLILGIGVAFERGGVDPVQVDIVSGPGSQALSERIAGPLIQVAVTSTEDAFLGLRKNRTSLVVQYAPDGELEFHFDPTNPEATRARALVKEALLPPQGQVSVREVEVNIPGARYIDFLVPGLIGMNLMGAGMWGIGYALVDLRVKKLLKRLLGTPMKRSQFLSSLVASRAVFIIPEVFVVLGAAVLLFGVPVKGSLPAVVTVAFVGAMAFAGLGLLTGSRAQKTETVTGLMNLIMMPMWLCSGIFFSAERFPQVIQPLIQALPLTQLNNALRAVILEGSTLMGIWFPLVVLAAWAAVSFALALRWFRWF